MHNQDDEEKVRAALAAIAGSSETSEIPQNLDDAEAGLRQALLSIRIERPSNVGTIRGRLSGVIQRLNGKDSTTDVCIAWLRKTGQFSEVELELVRRVKLFYESETGNAFVRAKGLSEVGAISGIAALAFIGGIWVSWLLLMENTPIYQVLNSFALGAVLGTAAQYLFNRSFRFGQMRDRVLAVAPWLREPQV